MNNSNTKKIYQCPEISTIILDNEISLAMESNTAPNSEPTNWSYNTATTDPFKNSVG
ncbi:MAG: hypothetical protein RIS29_936 [Bacteroidota bacterium]|jgi:hypothetical protein